LAKLSDKYDIPALHRELEVKHPPAKFLLTSETFSYRLLHQIRSVMTLPSWENDKYLHRLWKLAVNYNFAYLEKELRENENKLYLRRELARPGGLKKMLGNGIPVDILSTLVSKNIDEPGAHFSKRKLDPECDCGEHFITMLDSDESD
jgi:hypothetical protein